MEFLLKNHKTGILVALARKNYTRALEENRFCQNSHFLVRFFWGFIPKVLTTLVITFDMCFSKFIIETGGWLSCEGDSGNCMQIYGKS